MKTFKKAISLLLSVLMIFSLSSAAFAAAETEETYDSIEEYINDAEAPVTGEPAVKSGVNWSGILVKLKQFLAKLVNFLSNLLINDVVARTLVTVIPDSAAVKDYQSFDLSAYDNFYAGMDEFIDEPQGDAAWSLGYSEKSIMPEDFGEKPYAKGAYLPYVFGSEMYENEAGEKEELRVRTVIMNDGSGRGNVVFAVLDAMGLCNDDVRQVRAALKDFAAANNIVSINVSVTHIHTGIDSQGVWTDPAGVLFHNMISENVTYGVDRTFLKAVINGTKAAVEEAFADMKTGKMYYSSTDISDYVHDRTAPISFDPNLYKLEFVPDDEAATPTIIATFGCHPESASYDWNAKGEDGKVHYDGKFSADFVWYMEEVMNAAGYNFIYIQGDVCTVTSSRGLTNDGIDGNAHYTAVRYGYELGYITLALNMTEEERIAVNEATGDKLGVKLYANNEEYPEYTVWYDGLETVEAKEVKPVLNIALKQFFVEIENYAVATLGKTSIADNLVLSNGKGKYYTVTEVGYMEMGDAFKVYISPGETFGELLNGGSGLKGFPFKSIRETVGEDVIVFDLCNDAAGYVANDANFVMVGIQYNEINGALDGDTWCIISYGKHAASSFLAQYYDLISRVR